MKTFAMLAVYMGIGFILSYMLNGTKLFLYVAIALIVIGGILQLIANKSEK